MNINDKQPRKIIVGTDWWTDCDDAVAMRILAWAHNKGFIEILGIGINACMEYSAVSLDAFMRNEGLGDIEIGIDIQATDFGGAPPYQKRLATLPSKYISNNDCMDAVLLYRKLLAQQTEKIDLIEIGYPQVLSTLLMSAADAFSPLSGEQLVLQKVNKLWMMAGKWDEPNGGKENNFARNQRAITAAHYICEHWPTPITFLGWEVSNTILTGGTLKNDDILKQVLFDHGSPNGRSSWDPMLVLMACLSSEADAGYDTVHGKASVSPADGGNYFTPDDCGRHCYVVKNKSDTYYKDYINHIISGQF